MQIETRIVTPFTRELNEKGTSVVQTQTQHQFAEVIESSSTFKPRESKLDLISAAVVIGLTAQFIAFIFGLVTEYITRFFDNILLSTVMGLCVGVIAYALMTCED